MKDLRSWVEITQGMRRDWRNRLAEPLATALVRRLHPAHLERLGGLARELHTQARNEGLPYSPLALTANRVLNLNVFLTRRRTAPHHSCNLPPRIASAASPRPKRHVRSGQRCCKAPTRDAIVNRRGRTVANAPACHQKGARPTHRFSTKVTKPEGTRQQRSFRT